MHYKTIIEACHLLANAQCCAVRLVDIMEVTVYVVVQIHTHNVNMKSLIYL